MKSPETVDEWAQAGVSESELRQIDAESAAAVTRAALYERDIEEALRRLPFIEDPAKFRESARFWVARLIAADQLRCEALSGTTPTVGETLDRYGIASAAAIAVHRGQLRKLEAMN